MSAESVHDRVLVIANPASGRGHAPETAARLQKALADVGHEAVVCVSRSLAHIRQMVGDAPGRFGVVAVVGGDGTLGAAVDALARVDPCDQPVLAVLPAGTGNNFGPKTAERGDVVGVAKCIAEGTARPIHLGYLPDIDRFFALTVAIGVPGRATRSASGDQKRRFGRLTYFYHGVSALLRARDSDVRLERDGQSERLRAHSVLVANAPIDLPWFEEFDVEPVAGDLHLFAFHGKSPRSLADVLWSLWNRAPNGHEHLGHRSGHHFEVRAEPPLPVQVDGESTGETPVRVELAKEHVLLLGP